jgi:hypothetical protein
MTLPPLTGSYLEAWAGYPSHCCSPASSEMDLSCTTILHDFSSEETKNRNNSICDQEPVLRIRIHRFLGLLDPDPDPLVRGTDPDSSIIKQK